MSYIVENTVRKVGTRGHRAKSPVRHRFKQFVAGQRLLRNRKLALSEEQFAAAKEQVQNLLLKGIVAVTLPDGQRVTSLPSGEIVMGGNVLPAGSDPFGGKVAAPPPPAKAVEPEPVKEPITPPPPPPEEENGNGKKKIKKFRKRED